MRAAVGAVGSRAYLLSLRQRVVLPMPKRSAAASLSPPISRRACTEDNAARERSAGSSIFFQLSFPGRTTGTVLSKQSHGFNTAECVAPFIAKPSDGMGYYPYAKLCA